MQDINQKTREIIGRFAALIRHTIQKNLHRGDSIDLEDIEQEIKLKIWIFLKEGKKVDNFASYIKKVAYTTTIDELRKMMKQRPREELDELKKVYLGTQLLAGGGLANTPESLLEEQELRLDLNEIVESLSENRKQVLRLYLVGMSVEEISEFFRWDKTKVRHLLYRGIDNVRVRIKFLREKKSFNVKALGEQSQ